MIDGVRYAVPGDYATVEADGTITLLGRGSVSINTGGEKVFPEEVEEAIKTCPGVQDAVVVGVPDPRLGQVVAALVAGTAPDADAIKAHVREQARRLQGAAPRDDRRVGRASGDRQGGLQRRARAHPRVAGNERMSDGKPGRLARRIFSSTSATGSPASRSTGPEKRNAFSPEMLVRLCDAWVDIANDPAVRVVLLTGAGDGVFVRRRPGHGHSAHDAHARSRKANGKSGSPRTASSSAPRSCATRRSTSRSSSRSTATRMPAAPSSC